MTRYGRGSYVLITGATDGIGKAYAIEFAKLGFNIILVSRSEAKLLQVKQEFNRLFTEIDIVTIAFDFAKNTKLEDYESIFKTLQQQYDISILVNNVGIGERKLFSEFSNEFVMDLINVNILSQVLMTRIMINGLLARISRSAIIDISSFSASSPMVFASVYCASKVFNDYLSRAIGAETEHLNIDLLSVKPLYVNTSINNDTPKELTMISAEQCVNGSLDALGQEKTTNGHWMHNLQAILLGYIHEDIVNYMRTRTMNKKRIAELSEKRIN